MVLPAYLINLERSANRRQSFFEAAESCGLTVVRVPAFDGGSVDPARWAGADQAAFERLNGRKMLPGEYGCYQSHLRALGAFVESGHQHAIIFEDDILPDEKGIARAAAVLADQPDLQLVKLVNHRSSFFVRQRTTVTGDEIGRTAHGPQGSSAAYLVSRDAAVRLLSQLATMSHPFDVALERQWSHGVDVTSTRADLFLFSAERKRSVIGATRSDTYRKFPWWRRLDTFRWRVVEAGLRFHNAFRQRGGAEPVSEAAGSVLLPMPAEFATTAALLLLLTAFWWEKDVYRYAAGLLLPAALVIYFWRILWEDARPRMGWPGLLCLGWGAYVGVRILISPRGSAEGIYLLPFFYPAMGLVLLLWFSRPLLVAAAVMAVSLGVLAITLPDLVLQDPLAGPQSTLHKNTIHAAVAGGFIVLASLCFTAFVAARDRLEPLMRLGLAASGGAVFLLSLLHVLFLNSKGVWLALLICLPPLLVYLAGVSARRRLVAAALIAAAIIAVSASHQRVLSVSGPTAGSAVALIQDIASGEGVIATMDRMAHDAAVPQSMRERLMLWSNAARIVLERPMLGHGPSWLGRWDDRHHKEMSTNLLHNGYLEIAIRHGLLGLAFYAFLALWALKTVREAERASLVSWPVYAFYASALLYFALTLLTNSNNRLAIGESFMLVAFGFAFYCSYRLQRAGLSRPRTYF